MSVHANLRARTRAAHAEADAAFSRFNLRDRHSYISLLLAHARVLSAIEPELCDNPRLPPWRPRLSLLSRDLSAMGVPTPARGDALGRTSLAYQLGLLYVIEGSRLGGRILADRVHRDFSRCYLSAVHEKGEWALFTQELDASGSGRDGRWLESVGAGADRGFHLFARSAAQAFASPRREPDPKETPL